MAQKAHKQMSRTKKGKQLMDATRIPGTNSYQGLFYRPSGMAVCNLDGGEWPGRKPAGQNIADRGRK